MRRRGSRAIVLAALLLAPALAAALEVPAALAKSPYAEARAALLARGWRASPSSDDPGRCARGFEALCATYPEAEYCAGRGLPRCVFLWRDGEGALIELRTLGREEPTVEIVRCRSGCGARRLERSAPRDRGTPSIPRPSRPPRASPTPPRALPERHRADERSGPAILPGDAMPSGTMPPTRRALLAAAGALTLARPARLAAQTQTQSTQALDQGGQLLRRPIPSSGEMLPVVGLGTARRYEEASGEADLAPLRETVRRFHELGGTAIDTAPSYGRAEAVMGELVAELALRPRMFLATKVAGADKAAGQAEIERSFAALRTDRIDLVAVHNLRDITNALATLRDLKAAGRVRYVGATTSFERQHADFEAMMRRETLDAIQVDYALDDRKSAERILPLARDRGMAVMINLPFGRGRLFKAVEGKPLPDWAAEIDCASWAQVFLKYVVSHEAVTCAVPGMAQARYVPDNLAAARGRMPDAALRRRMELFIDAA